MPEKDITKSTLQLKDTPLPDATLMMTENDMRALLQTLINTTKSLDSRVTTLESKIK